VLHSEQVALGHKLFGYIDTQSTAVGNEIYEQPVSEYICERQAEIEKRVFFREELLCVGLSSRLPQAGSFITDSLSGVPILLTRDADQTVHGFLNVCRHRGSQVAKHEGKARSFVCPYHAWTYDLQGNLVARPQDSSFKGSSRETHGLTRLNVVERDGMIWVCPSPGRHADIDRKLSGLSEELAAYNLASFHHFDSCIITRGANFRLVSARRTIDELRDRNESEWDVMKHIVGIYVLFPNTVLVWQLDHVELWHIYPDDDDPERSCIRLDLYTPEVARTERMKQYWKKNLDLVVRVVEEEGFPVGETIQTGFHSQAQSHITFGTNEPALTHFHNSVTRAVQAAQKTGLSET
jgi:nitrite reductase/ring-hydroxylating ferredoxin subunit